MPRLHCLERLSLSAYAKEVLATHGDVGHYGRASGAIDYGAPSDQEIASFFHATRGGAGSGWAISSVCRKRKS